MQYVFLLFVVSILSRVGGEGVLIVNIWSDLDILLSNSKSSFGLALVNHLTFHLLTNLTFVW